MKQSPKQRYSAKQVRSSHSGNVGIWMAAGVLVFLGTGILIFNWAGGNPDETALADPNPTAIVGEMGDDAPNDVEFVDEEISEAPDVGITTDDILNNPEQYQGMQVRVRTEVEEWVAPRAFVLDAPGIINDNLLVITQDPQLLYEDPEWFGDAIWEVTGTVERFEVTVLEDLDFDLEAEIMTQYEGRPYIVADSVTEFEE